MDGFNVTLKETPIIYMPNFTPDLISVQNINIAKAHQQHQRFSLIIDLAIDRSLQFSNLVKNDLHVYIACSHCTPQHWLNATRLICDLPHASALNSTTSSTAECPQKVFDAVLTDLDKHNTLNLVNTFIGNYRLASKLTQPVDQNLKIYLQTYALNNVDNYAGFARALAARTTTTDQDLLDSLLLSGESKLPIQSAGMSAASARNLALIAGVVASLLVLLIVFTLVLVTVIGRLKRRCRLLSSSGVGSKQMRLRLDKCQQQIDQIELGVRCRCAQLFQQLHQDYLNELNHDMIYTLGLPVWNYKTYLLKMLSPNGTLGDKSVVQATGAGRAAMTCSSMSNSTTNSLLSSAALTPLQKQVNAGGMSVYATIKSSNMMMQAAADSQGKHTFLNYLLNKSWKRFRNKYKVNRGLAVIFVCLYFDNQLTCKSDQ